MLLYAHLQDTEVEKEKHGLQNTGMYAHTQVPL